MLAILVAALVPPISASLIHLAISRALEFQADNSAATFTGTPNGLIAALQKPERGAKRIPSTTARPATGHISIVNPLAGTPGVLTQLRSTHPRMADRIAALRALTPTRTSRHEAF